MARPSLRIPFNKKARAAVTPLAQELQIPAHFRCPISLELMKDPVTLPTGITYDRQSIETWFEMSNWTCPVTSIEVAAAHDEEQLIPNHSLRRMIQDWCVAHRSYGIERIPTPRVPVTHGQAADTLLEISNAACREDLLRCRQLVAKIHALAKESEKNRRCFGGAGAARVLSEAFHLLAGKHHDITLMEEILSAIIGYFPLDYESCYYVSSSKSLTSIVSILNFGSLAGQLSSILVLKQLIGNCKDRTVEIVATPGLLESLVKLIKEPVSPQMTKASMVTIYYLLSSNNDPNTSTRLAELGMTNLMLEILVDSDKSISEKALAVFDGLLDSEKGRLEARKHALAIPVLVKKLLRVSDLATEFAVSGLQKLCKEEDERVDGDRCSAEALQVGAFQKLLLLLQVGCGDATKEKATELLRLLNGKRESLECIESMDFKGLKRPF